jgi:hypothetical protein
LEIFLYGTSVVNITFQALEIFSVGSGDGEVTEKETIRQQTTDDDNGQKNTTIN